MTLEPTYLGKVTSVSGASVSIEVTPQLKSGLLIIEGRTHRVGQVGSFIRIPQGYNDLYGVISETSESQSNGDLDTRILKAELVGEVIGSDFERGIGQYPSISDEVHLVTENDLKKIYGNDTHGQITVGRLSSSDSIKVSIDLDDLVNKHSAILGSTGAGKSTSVASLLRSIVTNHQDNVLMPSARIVLFDIHGEYAAALKDISEVFSITPTADEKNFHIPFWCVSPDSLIEFLCGSNEPLRNKFNELILEDKRIYARDNQDLQLDEHKITSNTPLPFRLKKIWYDLVFEDNVNWNDKEKTADPAYKDNEKGDPDKLIAPKFIPPGAASNPPHKGGPKAWSKPLDLMKSRLLDNQYSFLLEPGGWSPDLKNSIEKDIDHLISEWIGSNKPITIFDLSGMPTARLELLLGSVLDILFEAAIWSRGLEKGFKSTPVLLVLEEAHRYLSSENSGLAKKMVRRIAKEGRKFGVGSMLISQRPSEIDETILSQCGTIFSLRITNTTDRNRVKAAMSDGLAGIVDSLPVLRTGEAIVTGEAAKLPMRFKFRLPKDGQFPDSQDPQVSQNWARKYEESDFKDFINCWRQQDAKTKKKERDDE
ncbi:ATP-binding protein [Rheinheimera sp.]|uniref:ATP-binding protein n=1 Tax=Rheinheimera sp. TaxID=1869214 RepID=UPI0027356386|nr:ATP-binding protein [Rheinheimera sp.]MDP2716733.1 ATP-binding protein [Rheinheimera sp.]